MREVLLPGPPMQCRLLRFRSMIQKDRRPESDRIRELAQLNVELRAAVMAAGKEIRKLKFGKHDNPVLVLLRRVQREARIVAKRRMAQSSTPLPQLAQMPRLAVRSVASKSAAPA